MVTKPVNVSGLDIGNLRVHNSMHLWVNGFGVSILSPKVIVSKYGPLPLLNGL